MYAYRPKQQCTFFCTMRNIDCKVFYKLVLILKKKVNLKAFLHCQRLNVFFVLGRGQKFTTNS